MMFLMIHVYVSTFSGLEKFRKFKQSIGGERLGSYSVTEGTFRHSLNLKETNLSFVKLEMTSSGQ